MAAWPLPVVGLVVALAMMTFVWLASLAKRDASIIDAPGSIVPVERPAR